MRKETENRSKTSEISLTEIQEENVIKKQFIRRKFS